MCKANPPDAVTFLSMKKFSIFGGFSFTEKDFLQRSFLYSEGFFREENFLQRRMTVSKHVDGQPSALLTREENQVKLIQHF